MERISTFSERFCEMIAGETYRQVSERLNLGVATVGHYAKGERTPKAAVVYHISNMYGVDADWLVGYDVPKYKETPKFKLEDLSPEQLALAQKIANATPEQVRALTAIVDQVLSLRG